MADFFTTLPKLTSPTNYHFWEIHIKLALTFITHSDTIFTADNMLNVSILPQVTDVDKIARRNFLNF